MFSISLLPFCLSIVPALTSAAARTQRSPPSAGSYTTGSNTTDTSGPASVSLAWYTGYHGSDFPLANVSWGNYTHMTYAFAETTVNGTPSLTASDPELLPQFVKAAHHHKVKALLSIGGWTGSQHYSSNVGSSENRTAFVNALTNLTTTYNLDGLDFDWEYPNNPNGLSCNTINPNDTSNFLSFLQELRNHPSGKNLTLTSATAITPWMNETQHPSQNISDFAQVLDWVELMVYDIWGSFSPTVGPNAPLNDTCASPVNQQGSAVSAIKAWTQAGMPANQIVLGVASYGHSFWVPRASAFNGSTTDTALALYPTFNKTKQPLGDKWDDPNAIDPCSGNKTGPGGTFDYWGLIDGKFIEDDGKPAHGITYRYDNCSQTAYVYNNETEVMVSYDDTRAFAAKGNFIKENNLRGFAMWEAGGDSHNNPLLGSIRSAMTA